jgi:hypothetical protein
LPFFGSHSRPLAILAKAGIQSEAPAYAGVTSEEHVGAFKLTHYQVKRLLDIVEGQDLKAGGEK